MSDDLSAAVAKLRNSTARLNELTDKAGEAVREVEDFLQNECSVGLNAWTPVYEKEELNWRVIQSLEYRRVGQKYRIAVVWTQEPAGDEVVKPWSDCSRVEKLETVKKLPDLIAAIAKKLDSTLNEAEQTTATVRGVLSALTGQEG